MAIAHASLRSLRATTTDGTLPAHVWPGGYPVVYFTLAGLTVCATCANEPDTSDPVAEWDYLWEGPPSLCDDCGTLTESAYGDPEWDRHCADAQYRADAWHRGTLAQMAHDGAEFVRVSMAAGGMAAFEFHNPFDVADMADDYAAIAQLYRVSRDSGTDADRTGR